MAEQDQLTLLQEQADDLVGYVQDYQSRLVEAQFQTVQANRNVRKLEQKLAQSDAELAEAKQRIAELEAAAPAPDPEPDVETPVQKTARKGAASQ